MMMMMNHLVPDLGQFLFLRLLMGLDKPDRALAAVFRGSVVWILLLLRHNG